MDTTRTRWAKTNRMKVQDRQRAKSKVNDTLTRRKRQKVLSKIVAEANKEYDIQKTLGDKLACLDENYRNPKFTNRLDEFAFVQIATNQDEFEHVMAYTITINDMYYAIDIKSDEMYQLSMEGCRGKYKNWVEEKCSHTWEIFLDEEILEACDKIAYYDTPVSCILLEAENVKEEFASNMDVASVTNDIMNYILVTDGLVHLNAYTDKSYYKK